MPHTPTGQGGLITESIWLLGFLVPGAIAAGAGLVHYGPRIPLWGWVVIASAVYAIQRAL